MPYFERAQNTTINRTIMIDNSTISNDNRTAGPSAKQLLYPSKATGAFHNSEERYNPPKCHKDTRVQILSDILEWISNLERQHSVFWLTGPAGAGKSAIAQTTAEKCDEQDLLAASFFFSRAAAMRNSCSRFVAAVVYQLIDSYPWLADTIAQILKAQPSIVNRTLEYQARKLILEPFQSSVEECSSKVVIIDGLDECQNEEEQLRALDLIKMLSRINNAPFCILISCRSESNIVDQFTFTDLAKISRILALQNVESTRNDIRLFLRSGFARIHNPPVHRFSMATIPTPWPTDEIIEKLVWKSSDQFIYASTVLRFVQDRNYSPLRQLQTILNIKDFTNEVNHLVALDAMYSEILSRAHNVQLTLKVVGCLIPDVVSLGGMILLAEKALQLQPCEVYAALQPLHSLMWISEPGSRNYYHPHEGYKFYHALFTEFLLNQSRSGQYFVDSSQINAMISIWSIRTLSTFNFKNSDADYVSLTLSYCLLPPPPQKAEDRESEDLYNELLTSNIFSLWFDILDIRDADMDLAKVRDALSLIDTGIPENEKIQNMRWYHEWWCHLAAVLLDLACNGMRSSVITNPRTGDKLNASAMFEGALDKLFWRKLGPFLPISRNDKLTLGLFTLRPQERAMLCRNVSGDPRFNQFAKALLPFTSKFYYTDLDEERHFTLFVAFLIDKNRAGPFYITVDIRISIVVIMLNALMDPKLNYDYASLDWYHAFWTMFIKDVSPTTELISALKSVTDLFLHDSKEFFIPPDCSVRVIRRLKSPKMKENPITFELLDIWTSSPLWIYEKPYPDDILSEIEQEY